VNTTTTNPTGPHQWVVGRVEYSPLVPWWRGVSVPSVLGVTYLNIGEPPENEDR
jgi:hypothetical protein